MPDGSAEYHKFSHRLIGLKVRETARCLRHSPLIHTLRRGRWQTLKTGTRRTLERRRVARFPGTGTATADGGRTISEVARTRWRTALSRTMSQDTGTRTSHMACTGAAISQTSSRICEAAGTRSRDEANPRGRM